jgi:DNA (cytosine-5)-methyltransferase 1
MTPTYYNDNDKHSVRWLRSLINAKLISPGVVDSRGINDIEADLPGDYTRAHFFAGIGGWDYALQLAGWPADLPVWTGSCPCQPFSAAGKGKGTADARHLWPEFLRLIEVGRPPVIFGEQVASKAGRLWLAGVRSDLEALGYSVGAADLCAAGVGAPHIRQRLFWVADRNGDRPGRLPHAEHHDRGPDEQGRSEERGTVDRGDIFGPWSDYTLIPCADGKTRRIEPTISPLVNGVPARVAQLRGLGNAIVPQVAAEFIKAYREVRNV